MIIYTKGKFGKTAVNSNAYVVYLCDLTMQSNGKIHFNMVILQKDLWGIGREKGENNKVNAM